MSTTEMNAKVNAKVKELRELRRMAAELEAEIESIQDQLKAHMAAQGVEELTGSDFKVSWKPVKSRRFDKNRMIATFGQDCYDSFCKVTTSRRFTISV